MCRVRRSISSWQLEQQNAPSKSLALRPAPVFIRMCASTVVEGSKLQIPARRTWHSRPRADSRIFELSWRRDFGRIILRFHGLTSFVLRLQFVACSNLQKKSFTCALNLSIVGITDSTARTHVKPCYKIGFQADNES